MYYSSSLGGKLFDSFRENTEEQENSYSLGEKLSDSYSLGRKAAEQLFTRWKAVRLVRDFAKYAKYAKSLKTEI